jgi:hypothetical protein
VIAPATVRTGEIAEHDRRVDRCGRACLGGQARIIRGEVQRARGTAAATATRDEDDRSLRLARRKYPRQLQ